MMKVNENDILVKIGGGGSLRIIGIDLIKVIACFLVVVIHTCPDKGYISVLFHLTTVSLPAFFMVNGYLLFNKTCKDFWYSYKKIIRILILGLLIGGIYSAYVVITGKQSEYSNPFYTTYHGFFSRGPLIYLWFLTELMKIYLVFPLLDYLFLKRKFYFVVLTFFFVILQCLSYYAFFRPPFCVFSFAYFLLGGIIKLGYFDFLYKIRRRWFSIPAVFTVVYVLVCSTIILLKQYDCLGTSYNNPLTIITTIMFFLWTMNYQTERWAKQILFVGSLTMPIYLFHPFIADAIRKVIHTSSTDLNHLLLLPATYTVAMFVAWIITRTPVLKNIIRM
jgi:surface polysaccharide O-acyltransferase-like enzyme